jgi:riboflavin synthase
MLIPETLRRTTLGEKAVGRKVNLESDLIAKYVERLLGAGSAGRSGLTLEKLWEEGFR